LALSRVRVSVARDQIVDDAKLHGVGGGEAAEKSIVEGLEGLGRLVFGDDATGQKAVAGGVGGGSALAVGGLGSAGEGAVGAREGWVRRIEDIVPITV
jgi:hypothetical protein